MAYGSAKHAIWTERCKNYAKTVQAVWEEGQRLNEIYTNETASGSDAAFVANSLASKQEFIDMVVLMQAFDAFLNNSAVATADRMANLTPLTQNP